MTGIICFGDSITRGENDIEKGGWVDRLKTYCMGQNLKDDSFNYSVYNLGISGETSVAFEHRFEQELVSRAALYDTTIITIGFGANDLAIQNGELLVSEQLYTEAIARCVQFARKKNVKVFIWSILPTIESKLLLRRKRSAVDILSYNRALQKIAIEYDAFYLDIYEAFDMEKKELLGDDGLHPNAKGHAFIASFFKDKLNF